jgi:co-chaperonin GroES (HSP10)
MPPAPIRLLHDQVLVEPLRKFERFEDMTPSGLLYVPSNPKRDYELAGLNTRAHQRSTEFLWWGRVILTGPGDKYRFRDKVKDGYYREAYQRRDGQRWPVEVQPGDIVLYERRPWADVKLGGREFTIVHEQQHINGYVRQAEEEAA